MNIEEKKKRKKEKILIEASKEFGEKGYYQASLNVICKNASLAKGTIYLYFKDKRELYLECLNLCYTYLYSELKDSKELKIKNDKFSNQIINYFEVFNKILEKNSVLEKLYFTNFFNTPMELEEEIKMIGDSLNKFNYNYMATLLNCTKIRNNYNIDVIIDFLFDSANLIKKKYIQTNENPQKAYLSYQKAFLTMIDIISYGILERGDD